MSRVRYASLRNFFTEGFSSAGAAVMPRPHRANPVLVPAILRALARLDLQEQQLADRMHLSPSAWSRAQRGVNSHYIHAQRLDELPPDERRVFLIALVEELARACGLVVVRRAEVSRMAVTMRAESEALAELAGPRPALEE